MEKREIDAELRLKLEGEVCPPYSIHDLRRTIHAYCCLLDLRRAQRTMRMIARGVRWQTG
jgi:hypothetical protein